MCEFCNLQLSEDHECGKDYPIHPCFNGDLNVRAQYIDGGIILYKDRNIASGYFDINYCPICGRRIGSEKSTDISDMVETLMRAGEKAVSIFPDYGPTTLDSTDIYAKISGYRVIVNYNILAKALYEAGYRKIEESSDIERKK